MAGGKKAKGKKEGYNDTQAKPEEACQGSERRNGSKATEFVYVEPEKPVTETEKKIRALRKKVREINALQEKLETEERAPTPEQAAKLDSIAGIERQIEQLLTVAAFEAKQAAYEAANKATEDALKAKADALEAQTKAEAARVAEEKEAARKAAAETLLAKQRREALEVLANVQPNGKEAKEDARCQTLLSQTSLLCEDIFHEDCLQGGENGVSKRSGWKLCLLARPPPVDPQNVPPEEPTELLGFLVYRLRPDHQCLSIAKIAVPEKHRGRGFGKHLMDWATEYAKKQGTLQYLSLSSLPEAVQFYQRFGFRPVEVSSLANSSEDLIEGQVYMEYRLKGRKGSKERSGSKT